MMATGPNVEAMTAVVTLGAGGPMSWYFMDRCSRRRALGVSVVEETRLWFGNWDGRKCSGGEV